MDITPRELRDVEIRESFRGYNRDDVNELLERAAATLESANERMQQLNERLSTVQSETGHTRETEDILHRTLLLAQRAADEAVGEATAKARQMLDDAEIQSRRLVADAEADARRRGETERRRLEEEVLDLAGRRDSLLADVEALTRFEADYRDRMVRALEADLSALRSRPPAAPGPRPETSEVDLPVVSEGFARRDDAAEVAPSTPTPVADVPAASAPASTAATTSASPPSFAASAPPFGASTPPAAAGGNEPERASTEQQSTQAVDVQSLFDRAGMGASASFDLPAGSGGGNDVFASKAASGAAPTATAPAPELASPIAPAAKPASGGPADAIEAEVLDDDAFFATLREAVHDDTPLGPRDEEPTGESMFFDQEAENSGFRDVFRRRR